MKFLYALAFPLFAISISYGQDNDMHSVMSDKGIVIEPSSTSITKYQISLLNTLNFDSYRKPYRRTMLQIKDGPLISVLSGREFHKEINPSDDALDESTIRKHEIITLIDLRWNYQPPVASERN